ncbi:sodium:solute symporter family protein [Oscillospiraceae bacterium 38-13]
MEGEREGERYLMDHTQLNILDLLIIGFYLLSMVAVGVYFVRRIKNTGDYYVAGRSLGPLVMMATVCATIIGGSGLMGRAGVAYSSGFKAVITAIPYLLGMFIFSGIAGRISDIGMRHDVASIPDLFDRRFGRTAKILLAAMVAFTMMGTVASQVTATATIINMLGGQVGLSYEAGALIACVIFMVYTASSGLFGVVYTDVLQFYMLILFVYILIPAASLRSIGGFSAFLADLDPALARPYLNGSILGDIVTYLVFTMAGAEMWQRAFAARNRSAAKKGMFLGTAVYGVTIALVYFMGVAAHQVIGDDALSVYGNTDAVVPALAIHVLPVGLTGLALAGILSVIMSTADSYLLVSVQTCVHDIGKTFFPQMTDKTEIRLSRLFSIALPLGALVIALYIKNAYNILMFAWSFYAAAAGIPAFAALFWRKATSAGVIAGMTAGFTVCVGWKLLGEPFGLGSAVPGTIACGIALIAVSLATCKTHPSAFLEAK